MEGAAVEEGGAPMRKKLQAEIDTSAPFRSVQEAVLLFGERILGGQVYANKLKEMHDETSETPHDRNGNPSRRGNITSELEETKQSLQKAREESLAMASCLSSLQEELQRTKKELQHLKELESSDQKQQPHHDQAVDYLEIEDVKFVEDYSKDEQELFQVKTETKTISGQKVVEFQKKRYVTFADPPSSARVVVAPPQCEAVLQRHPSLRKSKKKPLPLIPLIRGIFKKRGSSGVEPAREAN